MLYQQKTYTLLLINDNRKVIERIVNYYYTDISQASQIKAKSQNKTHNYYFQEYIKIIHQKILYIHHNAYEAAL